MAYHRDAYSWIAYNDKKEGVVEIWNGREGKAPRCIWGNDGGLLVRVFDAPPRLDRHHVPAVGDLIIFEGDFDRALPIFQKVVEVGWTGAAGISTHEMLGRLGKEGAARMMAMTSTDGNSAHSVMVDDELANRYRGVLPS